MLARAVVAATLVSLAPLQCGHTSDAELREDETPGDALWALAQRFHNEHDERAEEQTLQTIVERYPASRWAPSARARLARVREAQGLPLAADAAP